MIGLGRLLVAGKLGTSIVPRLTRFWVEEGTQLIIDDTALNAAFDTGRAALDGSVCLQGAQAPLTFRFASVNDATADRERTSYFKVADVYEVIGFRTWIQGNAGNTITTAVSLEAVLQDGFDETLSVDELGERDDLTVTRETIDAAEATDVIDLTTGRPFYLRPGVLYRVRATVDDPNAARRVVATIITRAKRRTK